MRSPLGLRNRRECRRLRLRGFATDRRRVARATVIGLRRREWRRRLRLGFAATARLRRRTVVDRLRFLAAIFVVPFFLRFATAILAGLWTRTNFILVFPFYLKTLTATLARTLKIVSRAILRQVFRADCPKP